MEIGQIEQRHQADANLECRLIYGTYPEVVLTNDNRARENYLREIVASYLYKDILELNGTRHATKISRCLKMIALQIGKEVSYAELGTGLGLSKNTIERFLICWRKLLLSRGLRDLAGTCVRRLPRTVATISWTTGFATRLSITSIRWIYVMLLVSCWRIIWN